tara:strand:+ start:938 stop:1213 length:276 start_codon:yes stop_codon:yes gene_type:complete
MIKEKLKQFFCLHKWEEKWVFNEFTNFIYFYKYKSKKCLKCKKTINDNDKISLSDLEMKEHLKNLLFIWKTESYGINNFIKIAEQMLEKYK